ncbi:hypothetical protein DOY81_006704 [Sarcophaga bullata]|nr:hypothetical protein DOY81_006704 [Sarcophaga bullata]
MWKLSFRERKSSKGRCYFENTLGCLPLPDSGTYITAVQQKCTQQNRTEQHQIHTHIYPQDHENIQPERSHKRTILNSKYGKKTISTTATATATTTITE